MNIYTLHEAEQRAELRKALRWPTYPNCSGSCQQDRACDCTAAVEELPPRPAMKRNDPAWLGMLAIWSVVVVLAVGHFAWPYVRDAITAALTALGWRP